MKKYKIGYTQGVYDMFHVGHLNLLMNAKEKCDYLIVGVNSDKLVKEYKSKETIIREEDRARIVESIKYVDQVYITDTLDKVNVLKKIKFDAVFIGDDWKGSARWEETEKRLEKFGIDVVYLPHTDSISSTMLREKIEEK